MLPMALGSAVVRTLLLALPTRRNLCPQWCSI